MDNNTPSQT